AEYREEAAAAADDAALWALVHRMVSERPHLREPATGRAVVSSAHPIATAAGLAILERGGNVIDAAVAVSFALGVVEPDASGIGGYGQMLVHRPGMERPWLVEFMTRVPQDAGLDNAALLEDGRLPDDGPVLANVPGTVAGMRAAWERFGSLPWAALLEPAIRAAEDGYAVSDGLATTLRRERAHFLKYPGSRALFYRDCPAEPPEGGDPAGTCVPYAAGETLRNPDLADVLGRIASHGPDALYGGDVGRRMAADLRAHGSALQLRDLERYFAAEREPVCGEYRGDLVCSSAPPVAGGAALVAKLNLLEHVSAPALYTEHAATLHAMIEAWRLQPSTRGRIADPGLWPVDVQAVTSQDTADARWRCFQPDRALREDELEDPLTCAAPRATEDALRDDPRSRRPDPDAGSVHRHASGTTSFVVAAVDGSIVSTTQTLGTWGGNFYVTPGLGFLYNDKLGSYADDRDDYGARLPNARHGSTISPTIGYRGTGTSKRPWFGIGAAGNAWITAAVYEMAVAMMDFGLGPQDALELPRFLPSSRSGAGGEREPVVLIESGVSPDVLRALEAMGHRFQTISLPGELRMGYGAAAMIGDGRATAGADPRRSGAAGAVQ
ncbi:MAG: gamma-glutamyltransferase family protein, partial [Longimicrobiales bacterium]